ncbi:hypothetical protein [Natrinema amylolyticum]|uniref:hypothetical protein n=1 Tax=Natrinema amylolyticum TaxID=2878679 RepID=UPI001CF981EF|nr:hypothetical protein [Natrinema amylolyticum]
MEYDIADTRQTSDTGDAIIDESSATADGSTPNTLSGSELVFRYSSSDEPIIDGESERSVLEAELETDDGRVSRPLQVEQVQCHGLQAVDTRRHLAPQSTDDSTA